MGDVEVVEQLTSIVKQQADIIAELHSVVMQLGAYTELEEKIQELKKGGDSACN